MAKSEVKNFTSKPGYEPIDDTVVEAPTRLRLPFNRAQQMRDFIRQELSRVAQDRGEESFEEADDLEIEDDQEPMSRYELRELDGDPDPQAPANPVPGKPDVAPPGAAPAADRPAPGSPGKEAPGGPAS